MEIIIINFDEYFLLNLSWVFLNCSLAYPSLLLASQFLLLLQNDNLYKLPKKFKN